MEIGDQTGLLPLEFGPQKVPQQVMVAIPLTAAMSGSTSRFLASSCSRTAPDPSSSRIASHRDAHIRSRTDVRARNDASVAEIPASSSECR
jgi:hypothetical protein